MEYEYYNVTQINRIESITKNEPEKAIELLEEYLKKYQYDYHAWFLYIADLIIVKRLDDAENIINDVKLRFSCDSKVINYPDRVDVYKRSMFLNELKLFCYQNKYEKAYNYIMTNKEFAKEFNIGRVMIFLKKILGKNKPYMEYDNLYVYDQINDYDEDRMRKYIYKHSYKYNESADKKDYNIFAPDFDYNTIIEEIKKYIPSDNKLYYGIVEDIYIFKYDLCGTENNKWTDYFKVVCIHGTSNIITISPVPLSVL